MNAHVRNRYAQARRAGYPPADALRTARIVDAFEDMENAGMVRIIAEPEQESYFDVYGEPEGYVNEHGRRVSAEEQRAEIVRTLEQDGCWYVAAQVQCSECEEWRTVDGIGMNTGYGDPTDWRVNWYVPDLMSAALNEIVETAVRIIEAEESTS